MNSQFDYTLAHARTLHYNDFERVVTFAAVIVNEGTEDTNGVAFIIMVCLRVYYALLRKCSCQHRAEEKNCS